MTYSPRTNPGHSLQFSVITAGPYGKSTHKRQSAHEISEKLDPRVTRDILFARCNAWKQAKSERHTNINTS